MTRISADTGRPYQEREEDLAGIDCDRHHKQAAHKARCHRQAREPEYKKCQRYRENWLTLGEPRIVRDFSIHHAIARQYGNDTERPQLHKEKGGDLE